MDITILSATAVALLSPYLAEAGKAAAKKAGEAIADTVPKIYQVIKAKFAQKPTAAEALTELEKNPTDEDLQAAIRVQLKKLLAEDSSFANQLQQLIETAQAVAASNITNVTGDGIAVVGDDNIVTGKKGIHIGGNVQSSTINSGDK